jgi:hypothetical protein
MLLLQGEETKGYHDHDLPQDVGLGAVEEVFEGLIAGSGFIKHKNR